MPALVTAEQLSKTFQVKVRDPGLRGALRALFRPRYRDVHAVRDVTFRIEPGEIVAFLGPNGAGKTTTLKMLTASCTRPAGGWRWRGSCRGPAGPRSSGASRSCSATGSSSCGISLRRRRSC